MHFKTYEDKEGTRRILHASPSALLFALHNDTTPFCESWKHWNRLDPSGETREKNRFTQILRSMFEIPLSEKLYFDMHVPAYGDLYSKLGIRAAVQRVQVSLATLDGKYIETMTGGNMSLFKAAEDFRAGQLISYVDPMTSCDDGIAYFHLDEFQTALEPFDKAFSAVQDPILKAKVLNNKGWVFLNLKQYQKAIECFEEGIAFDPEGEICLLRENKQVAEEYLARATDADNLTEPTQIRFIQNQPVPFEETLFYEFKEVKGGNPANSITKISDEYAVAFFNSEGGRIFWGIRNDDRITVGVTLDDQQRDEVRRKVSEKLWGIRPPISDEDWDLEFHNVYDLQGNTAEDSWVVELVISPQQEKEVFYTNSGELFVKTPGGKQKLLGPQVTEFIRGRLQDATETA